MEEAAADEEEEEEAEGTSAVLPFAIKGGGDIDSVSLLSATASGRDAALDERDRLVLLAAGAVDEVGRVAGVNRTACPRARGAVRAVCQQQQQR